MCKQVADAGNTYEQIIPPTLPQGTSQQHPGGSNPHAYPTTPKYTEGSPATANVTGTIPGEPTTTITRVRNQKINVGGTWKVPNDIKVNVGGIWKTIE